MNGKKARAIRKEVYGITPITHRIYHTEGRQVIADKRRRTYQKAKGR